MTEIQSIMLAFCFGSVLGTFIVNIAFIIKYAIDEHRDKKRRRKETEETR